jgi:hypothetical protein
MEASQAQPRNCVGSNNQPLRHNTGSGKYSVSGFTGNTQDNSSISAGYNGACISGEYGWTSRVANLARVQNGEMVKDGENRENRENGEGTPQRDDFPT